MKSDKGNGVTILDQKLYNNAIEEIIPDPSKFGRLYKDSNLKRKASLQHFLHKLKEKTFSTKLNMISFILPALLLLISMVLLKSINSPPVIHFLHFAQLFRL